MEGNQLLNNKPYIIIFSTTTIDGKIASKTGYSFLSCPKDLERLHKLRKEIGAVAVGAETVIKDDPSLRLKYFEGENPLKIIIDGRLRSPLNARVFTINPHKTILITSNHADQEKLKELMNRGIKVLLFQGPNIDLREAVHELYKIGIMKLMVEGGGILNWNFLQYKLVDELRVTISPYVFGSGRSIFEGIGYEDTKQSPEFKLIQFERCECMNEIHLIYKVYYKS